MNIQAQKIELIQLLLSTTKPTVIKKIKAIFEEAETQSASEASIAHLEKEIEAAESDIKNGRTYSSKQVKAYFKY